MIPSGLSVVETPLMSVEIGFLLSETKEESMAFCDVCKHRVCDMKQHLETEEHKRNLRRTIGMGLLPCPHCGGRLFFDEEEKEWHCINCGRQPERPVSTTDNSVSGKKMPVSTANNLLTTGDKPVIANKNAVNVNNNRQAKAIEKGRHPFIPAQGPELVYKGHSIDGIWWPPREIAFRRRQMLWLIEHLPELREGYWPANPAGSGYIDLPIVRKGGVRSHQAPFITAAEYAAEVEARLEKCGIDGLILLAIECWGESEASLGKYLRMPEWSIRKRAKNALRYISGFKRKRRTYREFRA